MNKFTKFWMGVACKEHVENGVNFGFCQFCHGKSKPANQLSYGDYVIYYSPKTTMRENDLYQKFTAIGKVIDNAPYQIDLGQGFKPFRRNLSYFDAPHVAIKPLIPLLPFIKNKSSWGYVFRYGFLEIDPISFDVIVNNMIGFNPIT